MLQLAASLLATTLPMQTADPKPVSSEVGSRFGRAVLALSDLDKDGVKDLAVGAPTAQLATGQRWEIRCAVGGAFVAGPTYALEIGMFHSVGDLNEDGLADGVLIGKQTYLCRTMREGRRDFLRAIPMPYELQTPVPEIWKKDLEPVKGLTSLRAISAGDVDGDGRADVLLTLQTPFTPSNEGTRIVRVLALSSARTDAARWTTERPLPFMGDADDCFGHAVASPGDLDGDGRADLLISEGVEVFQTTVSAYSLAKGERLWERRAGDVGGCTGLALAALGDRDSDGAVDVMVGSSDWYWHGTVYGGGSVTLVSGRSGKPIWSIGEERYSDVLRAAVKPR